MQELDQQQDQGTVTETLHLYVVREPIQTLSWLHWLPLALSLFALSVLVTLCAISPYRQQVVRTIIRVPAVFPPLQTYSASAQIEATGTKTYQATNAYGVLTITNGSVLAVTLPSGMLFAANDGTEVATLTSAFVSPGSALGYGFATVRAKAITGGKQGNIGALAINSVVGTSLFVRNLQPFHGGKDAHTVRFITTQDQQRATDAARALVTQQEADRKALLAFPCQEVVRQKNSVMTLLWSCQYVTFHIPSYMHVTAFRLEGRMVVVETWRVQRPNIIFYK